MKNSKLWCSLLALANALLVKSEVNFKVIAVTGTPKLSLNGKSYNMQLDEYPVYNVTVNVNPPVTYHYILNNKEESFERTLKKGNETLNEFFDRSITVKYHPLLPKAYEPYETYKDSKLYDDTHVATIIINCDKNALANLHANPKNEDLKIENVEVIYANPYTVKKFTQAKLSISGQSSLESKKLSYKISNLKTADNKELYNRSSIKLRGENMDASFLRDKIYGDVLNTLGVPCAQNKFARLFINNTPIGLFDLSDDYNNNRFLRATFNKGEKFNVTNSIFKADYWPSGGVYGDLGYYGENSKMYEIYYYKGDLEKFDNDEMVKNILVPLLYDIDNYPETKTLNLDIPAFLKALAMEFAGGGCDNFWLRPGNYYIFKNGEKISGIS